MNDAFIDWHSEKKFRNVFFRCLQNADTVLIVDYGHGLFTDSYIQYIKEKKISSVRYTANAQANAGNHGLNSVLRYEWCDSIVLNGSEVQLEMRQRKLEPKRLLKNFSKKVSAPNILITLGKRGLIYKAKDGSITEMNAISSLGIVDRTGAGDALLACYVAFDTLDLSKNDFLNFCNLGGFFASTFVGNEKKLTLNDLYKLSSNEYK
jgi:sugar/nucleoside kinase (ribokinase family)